MSFCCSAMTDAFLSIRETLNKSHNSLDHLELAPPSCRASPRFRGGDSVICHYMMAGHRPALLLFQRFLRIAGIQTSLLTVKPCKWLATEGRYGFTMTITDFKY